MPLYKSDVHVDRALTNMAGGYQSQMFVGTKLMPELKVEKDSDKFFVFGPATSTSAGRSDAWGTTATNLEWEDSTDPPEISNGRATLSYSCVQYGAADFVTDTELRNSDAPLRPFQDKTAFLMERVALELERAIATKCTTAANFENSTTLSGTAQWSETTWVSDPVGDVLTGAEAVRLATSKYPNVMVAGPLAHIALMQHPNMVEFTKRFTPSLPGDSIFSAFFAAAGITQYYMGGAVYNNANEGATEVPANVWGGDVVLAYVPPAPSIGTPAFGYTFTSVMAKIQRENRKNNAVKLIASRNWDLKFVSVDNTSDLDALGGYLIKSAAV